MCNLWTAPITWQGAGRLDTTVKSGAGLGKIFAPTWELVGGIKHHETGGQDARWTKYAPLTQEQYIEGYYALIRERYKADPAPFLELLTWDRVVLCCYCRRGVFCHRHLAAEILFKIASAKHMRLFWCGEA